MIKYIKLNVKKTKQYWNVLSFSIFSLTSLLYLIVMEVTQEEMEVIENFENNMTILLFDEVT